jgi:aryl-alcohol dehydrogenase-like predicted oxidoreductase
MEKRRLGKTDMQVSVLGFGGAEIGYQNASLKTVEELLVNALNQGLNVIDTAECYSGSEELIGAAVSSRRKDFYLFTKCGHGSRYDIHEWSAAQIENSVNRSLQRLRTDHLDLVQLHSCDEGALRKGEVIEALQKAKKAGKTRYIGYSGDGRAARYAIETGAFDTLQTSVSIADQEALELTVPLAKEKNMGVIAKRPIANAAWRGGSKPNDPYLQPYWERLQKLKYDFINGNMDHSIATALRFTLSVPGVHTAIVGTTKPGRWAENAKLVSSGPLSDTEFQAIRSRWKAIAGPDWIGQV